MSNYVQLVAFTPEKHLHISKIFCIFASWKHQSDLTDEWNWLRPTSPISRQAVLGRDSSYSCRITKNCQRFLLSLTGHSHLGRCRPSSATWAPLSAHFCVFQTALSKLALRFKKNPIPFKANIETTYGRFSLQRCDSAPVRHCAISETHIPQKISLISIILYIYYNIYII